MSTTNSDASRVQPAPTPGDRRGLFYGWWIVAVCVLLMATIFGTIVNSFSLFVLPVGKELPSISIAMFTIAYSFITLAAIPLSPIVGNLLKKWDARLVIAAGVVLAAVANVGLSMTQNVAWLYAMALLQGVAVTLGTTIPIATVITNWFVRHRGLALGIAMAGSGLGGLIFVPLIDGVLIPGIGWRSTYLVLAAIQILLLVPLTLLVVRTRPEEKGCVALGAAESAADSGGRPEAYGLSQGEMIRTPAFWLLGLALIAAGISVNGMISGFKPMLVTLRSPDAVAAWILATVGLFVMLGKFVTGWLFDRLGLMLAIVLVSAANAAQFFFMLNPTNLANAALFNTLHGFGATMVTVTPAYLAARLFGQKHYAANYGWVSAFAMAGAGLAPLFGALFFGSSKATSDYAHAETLVWAWLVMGVVGLGFYIVTVLVKPRWEPAGYRGPSDH